MVSTLAYAVTTGSNGFRIQSINTHNRASLKKKKTSVKRASKLDYMVLAY